MDFKKINFILLFLALLVVDTTGNGKILSRKKRWLAFPDGSSVAASMCCTIGMIGNPVVDYISWAVNWGCAYDLPNQTWVRQNAHGFHLFKEKPKVQRRYRRDLYSQIEIVFDKMGFNGRDCMLRALCESSKYLNLKKGNMIEELLKTVFSVPKQHLSQTEHPDIHEYTNIYNYNCREKGCHRRKRIPRELRDCTTEYPNCEFSLLEMILGRYAVEPTKHGPVINVPFM
ncbi:hypothetical protein ACFFRR_008699 [Megaselia abdita]